jgi:hypothetical protein
MRKMPIILHEDPILAMPRIEIELPTFRYSSILMPAPNRAKLLRESDEPKVKKSTMDIEAPRRTDSP